MTSNDATIQQLIQRIQSQLPAANLDALNFSTNFWDQISLLVNAAASYTQILSTVEGPIAQAVAATILNNVAAQQAAGEITAGAAAEATSAAGTATLGAETAGAGAVIVLIYAFVLASLFSDQGESADSQALKQLQRTLRT
jgi:hypothetical protein